MTKFQFQHTAMLLWLIVSCVTESWASLVTATISIGFSVASIWTACKERRK